MDVEVEVELSVCCLVLVVGFVEFVFPFTNGTLALAPGQ